MGGCATKPKVLKEAGAGAGAPVPVPQKEEGAEDLAAVKEGVRADDEANRRRSLSNLFKEVSLFRTFISCSFLGFSVWFCLIVVKFRTLCVVFFQYPN